MTWMVGIDEAGYGPNLGPFVMSMVTVRVPERRAGADLWHLLSPAVCRAGEEDHGRLVVDDSKRVYSTARGLGALERGLLPFTRTAGQPCSLRHFWMSHALTPHRLLRAETWYHDDAYLPLAGPHEGWRDARLRLEETCQRSGVHFGEFRAVVVFPRQFNALVERHGSKAAVPCWALKRLLRRLGLHPAEETLVYVDKLGGRNRYQPFLQSVFPDRLVLCGCESAASSSYLAPDATGDIRITFEPEADRRFLPVALASMLSKYLREVLMSMFNRFWERHVPGLKATAGYPSDAARFYRDILPARGRLGIGDEVLWRCR